MSKYHDDNTIASEPGRIKLSRRKLRRFHPELFGIRAWLASWGSKSDLAYGTRAVHVLAEHLGLGDGRAAVVVKLVPLLVAAYSDDLDCVALLRFESAVVQGNLLKIGGRLLTVNTYSSFSDEPLAEDLTLGPRQSGRWSNFHPLIADFLTDDEETLIAGKARISDEEWARAWECGARWIRDKGECARNGAPLLSMVPAKQ